jgi:acyl-CoA dehydrogenase
MDNQEKEALADLARRVGSFALRRVEGYPGLDSETVVPAGLWRDMAAEGLFGISLPKEHGGGGFGWPGVVAAAEALAAGGGSLGVTLSWLIHVAVARHAVADRARPDHAGLLSRLAKGQETACLAVTEPDAGAHPRRLKTTAVKTEGGWSLDGEKTFLTNGPIAGVFCVIAITGERGGKKEFSAFLVPRETPGLSVSGPMPLEFLRPCPHGGITLKRCRVPESALLGQEGRAFEDIVKPFREVEDIAMTGAALGALRRQGRLAGQELAKSGGSVDGEDQIALGRFLSQTEALRALALAAAEALEEGPSRADVTALVLACRELAETTQALPRRLVSECGLDKGHELCRLTAEMEFVGKIARNVARQKLMRLGASLIG